MSRLGTKALLLGAVLLAGCANDQCGGFTRRIRDPGVAKFLEYWVDKRLQEGQFGPRLPPTGKVRMPGDYSVPLGFDPKFIGLGDGAEARVIIDKDGRIEGIFFGEENFQGVLVRAEGRKLLAVPSNILTQITPRVATVCQKRD